MPGPWDDYAPPAKAAGPWDDYATPAATTEKPFFEKLGNFVRNVYNNPPPSIAGARDVIKGLPAAATELTWGADPQAAEQAAGTAAQAAQLGLGFRGLGGEGVLARPISAEARAAPLFPPRVPLLPSAGETAVEAASRLPGNVTLPRYLATEGTTAPRVASGLSQVPFSGQPVVRSANELLTDLGRAKGEIAGGAATAETAGERARSSLESFTTTRSQKPVSEAYDAVDALINPDARVPLTNTAALVQEMNTRRANANIPGTSKAVDIVSRAVKSPLDDVPPELQAGILKRNPELAQPPGMDYAGIKDLRTYLRSKTPMQLITEGIDPTEAKRILGSLTKDLESVISQSSPEALAAWREANALASRTARERKALTRTIGLQGNASAEQVFNRLLTYAGSKSGADLGRLRLARKAMGPEAWSDVGAAMINRMGAAPEGAFSADRFVTAFGNMSGAAKQELFTGQQAAALSDLFLVSKHVQDRITRLSNPSGTARNTIPFAIAAHLWTDPITAVANLVGQRLLAEVLSRPAVVRAATAVSRASLSGNPYAKERALAALRAAVQMEGLLPKQPPQDQQLPRMQYGGRPTGPTVVGEDGPEVFVPDQPGTIVPADEAQAAREAAAARTGHRGRREGAGTQFVEGGYGIPAAYRALDEGAKRAFEEGGKIQHYGNEYYDAGPVVAQAIGAAGAPLVAPAMEGAVLGAGAIRRARPGIGHNNPPPEARFSQYAEAYPENVAGGVLKTDKKTGKEYTSRLTSPEADEFMAAREGISEDMKKGYEPYYDPAKRTLVDPSNYPDRNVDTLTLQPKTQKSIDNYLAGIDAPITRERLRAAYERGKELGNADNWYFMGQLENDFVKELGQKEGRKAFLDRFASGMAATTSGQSPTTNYLMSHYLNYLEQTGKPMPKGGWEIPAPVSGQYMMSNVDDYMRMREAGGYAGLGAKQPKMHNFARSFIGDLDRAVMDDQMAKGMVGHMADVDKNFANNARKQAFGLLEQPLHAEAAAAGVRPGAYQDVAWAGFKGTPGKPMISHINDAIERTHRLTGMPKEEIVRRGIIRNEIPVYGFSAPMPTLDRSTAD